MNFYTSSYVGLQHQFSGTSGMCGRSQKICAPGELSASRYGIAQALRPFGEVDSAPTRNWRVQATAAYNNTRGFHVYDAVQSGFAVSYAMPFRRGFREESGDEVPLQYPIRFSAGMQQESFFNFPGTNTQQFRPYFSISLF